MKGFTKLDNKLLFSNELQAYGKLVLMGLTYFTRNGTGKCFCKKATLASYLNLSLYQVRCGLVELEELEVINIQRLGQGNTDIITINDLKPRNEKFSHPSSIIEEEVIEEEEISTANTKNNKNNFTFSTTTIENELETSSYGFSHDYTTDTADNHKEHTKALHTALQDEIRPHTYQTWFVTARVVSKNDDKMTIGFPLSQTQVGWIYHQYVDLLSKVSKCSVKVVKLKGGSDGITEKEKINKTKY